MNLIKRSIYGLYHEYVTRIRGRTITKVNQFNYSRVRDRLFLLYTPSGLDYVQQIAERLPKDGEVYLLVLFNWYVNPLQVVSIRRQYDAIRKCHPGVHVHFLLNSSTEVANFRAYFPDSIAHFINQNIFLDENVYRIHSDTEKEYDAIYNGRMGPFKRFELATATPSLAIITCSYEGSVENPYYDRVAPQMQPGTRWLNYENDTNKYGKLTAERVAQLVNQARSGLILSRIEGACFASTEYQMCGIPVVSTDSKGGRDVFFTPETAIIVDDTAEAVAAGVRDACARQADPQGVREITLSKIAEHRTKLLELIENLTRESLDWEDIAQNKRLDFSNVDEFMELVS